MANNEVTPTSPSNGPLEQLRTQISAGPLPQTIENFKTRFQTHRRQILVGGSVLIILIMVLFGLRFGGLLDRIFRPGALQVSQLPTVTPTIPPAISTSFDSLRDQIRAFSGVLPDPAPPAVDQNISLQPAKR